MKRKWRLLIALSLMSLPLHAAEDAAPAAPAASAAAIPAPAAAASVSADTVTPAGAVPPQPDSIARESQIRQALKTKPRESRSINPNYIIGPGDQLIISLWRKRTQTFNPVVDPNGFVTIRVEKAELRFSVNGLYFKDLKARVIRELATLTKDIDPDHPESSSTLVDVTLGDIRGVNIMVLGEVESPGQYTLKATGGSVFEALTVAGGIKPGGSLRRIAVRRSVGKADELNLYQFDLYSVMSTGKMEEELACLQDGDVLIVPQRDYTATLKGEVKRLGVYEIVKNESLASLIETAGDLTPEADPSKIKILRIEGREQARLIEVDLGKGKDFVMRDGDQIEVIAKPRVRRLNIVSIEGEGIKQPGRYEYRPDMTLADLIKSAGGLHEDAVKESAVLVRTKEDFTLESSTVNLAEFLAPSAKPFPLRTLDKLIVLSHFFEAGGDKYVTVAGHIREPGKYLLSAGLKLSDLLLLAGGFNDQDFKSETWLDRADLFRVDPVTGRATVLPVNLRKVLAGDEQENIVLRSADHLRVYAAQEMRDKRYVRIGGEVRKPGQYDLTDGMTLGDLISMAGGLTEYAEVGRIEITRYLGDPVKGQAATAVEVALNEKNTFGQQFILMRDDSVMVRRKPEFREMLSVTVSGEVQYPGQYVLLNRTETLSDLIARAGGFTTAAQPDGGRLIRRIGAAGTVSPRLGGGADNTDVVIDLVKAVGRPKSRNDLELLPGDQIIVPRFNGVVTVSGEVEFPGTFQFVKGMSVSDYVTMAGGYTDQARKSDTAVIYPNGAATQARRFWFFSANVKPGSSILVPKRAVKAKK